MEIYVAHSRDIDYKNGIYDPIRKSSLNDWHNFILPHEDPGASRKSKELIRSCGLMVAEVSHPKIGLGIEIGWADAFDVPVVCFLRTGGKLSASLVYITGDIFRYSDPEDFIDKLTIFLNTSAR